MGVKVNLQASDEEEFLTRIVWLYYVNGMTQAQIAKELNETRLRVNKAIGQARQQGIVRIEIASPFAAALSLQEKLATKFGLKNAYVGISSGSANSVHDAVGAATAFYLTGFLDRYPCRMIGLSWGTTLDNATRWLKQEDRPNIEVVSLLGGLWQGDSINTFSIVANFARLLGARHSLLAAPIYADTAEAAQALMASKLLKGQLQKTCDVDLALLSAGDMSNRSHLIRHGLPDDVSVEDLIAAGAVGDVLGQFFDADGRPIDHPLNARAIGLRLQSLRNIKHVALAAGGAHKVSVVGALLRTKLVHTLITDDETAKTLLQLY